MDPGRGRFTWVPERFALGNAGPVLLVIGLALVPLTFARVPYAFVGFLVVFSVATVLSFAARDWAGGTPAIPMWRASAGWTAAEFHVRYRASERGKAALSEAIEIAKARGYRVEGEPVSEPGRFGTNQRFHLVRTG